MTNIVKFNGFTTVDIEPDKVLDGARNELSEVIVIGNMKDNEFYVAASIADKKRLLWMIKQFEFKLFNGDYD